MPGMTDDPHAQANAEQVRVLREALAPVVRPPEHAPQTDPAPQQPSTFQSQPSSPPARPAR